MMSALLVALNLVGSLDVPAVTVTSLVHDAFSRCHCLHLLTDSSYWTLQILRALFDTPPCPLMLTPGAKDSAKYLCTDYVLVFHESKIVKEILFRRRPYTIDRVMVVVQKDIHVLLENEKLFGDAEAVLLALPSLQMFRLTSAVLERRAFNWINDTKVLFPGPSWLKFTNLQNRTLVVSTFTLLPFSLIDNGTKDGIEMKMFNEASKRMNFSWVNLEPPQNNRYGEWLPNKTWSGGIAGLLIERRSEVAFCTLYLVYNKILHLDMTTPWNQVCITYMVPRPRRISQHWAAPLSPFETRLWFGLLAGTLVMCSALWFVTRSYAVPMTVDHSVIWVLGLLLLGSFPSLGPDRSAARKLLLCWTYFGLLMVTAYCSKLVAHLSIKKYERPLNTIEDLVKADMYWGMDYEVPVVDIFDHEDSWALEMASRFKLEENPWDREVRLRKRDYAILGTRVNNKNFYEGVNIKNDRLYSLRGMHQCLNRFNIAFALPKLSPLTQPFSRAILLFVESGLTLYWHGDVVRRLSNTALASLSLEVDVRERKEIVEAFSLDNLGGIFVACIVGHSVALCIFFIEQVWWRYRRAKLDKKKAMNRHLQSFNVKEGYTTDKNHLE